MFKGRRENKKILLIDSNKETGNDLKSFLQARDYAVQLVSSDNEVVKKTSVAADIILINLKMPDQDGIQICRKLKNSPNTGPIPIVIICNEIRKDDIKNGLYVEPDDYILSPYDTEELIARIETVLQRSKVYRSAKLVSQGEEAIVGEIKRIIMEGLVIPYFQPIFQFKPFKVVGLEVLSRPNTDSMLSNPEVLFKAAIQFGFYRELEIMSWKKAINSVADVLDDKSLFLNCNPYFIEGTKCPKLVSLFEDADINVENVVLEITERSAVTNYRVFFEHLKTFRENGFKFAVDDVGGGYASLESIVETKPEIVKIDRHIITDIDKDEFKQSVVKFIVSFCKENAVFCIAEGIERKEELDMVLSLGVDAGQGYYLYRPTAEVVMDDMMAVSKKVPA